LTTSLRGKKFTYLRNEAILKTFDETPDHSPAPEVLYYGNFIPVVLRVNYEAFYSAKNRPRGPVCQTVKKVPDLVGKRPHSEHHLPIEHEESKDNHRKRLRKGARSPKAKDVSNQTSSVNQLM